MYHLQNKGISLWAGVRQDGILSGFEGLDETLFCSLLNLGQLD